MAYKIERVEVWAGHIPDRPGSLAKLMEATSDAGVNLGFAMARPAPDKPGDFVVFFACEPGTVDYGALAKAGLSQTPGMHVLRIDGPDRHGLGATIARAVGDAGINMCDVSAVKTDHISVVFIVFASAADADRAKGVLRDALAKPWP